MNLLVLSIAALSGLGALLAFLLEVADSYLGFYGECHIDINEGERELVVHGGESLLSTLMEQGIFIPSACGGRGSCGYCRVKVHEGGGPLLPTETPWLEPEEVKDNVRISCQIKVRGNMYIEIPPELFLIKEFRSRVEALYDLTDQIKELRLRLIEPDTITFKPGQYIQFQVPEYKECPESVYRAYSIASTANEPDGITLMVTKVPGGLATTYIHEVLKEGDEVAFNGPYGDFYLRDSDREIMLVATGSGLAPIMSILHQMAEEGISRKTTLIFGARQKKNLFYLEEIEAFKKRIPGLEVILALSSPEEEDRWQGERGRVTDVLEKIVKNGANKEAYLCGNPAMVEATVELLTKKGIPEELIFYDKFT
ncbi:MAG: 2Fe-2S iron-sulfur cluster binding domain-containing protein [Syntrophobacterales bacterium]|nr:MAG: 2Fe-2S iron-sulfur cluster binding domain-containing protein [Syntrophobacterales bacterium]